MKIRNEYRTHGAEYIPPQPPQNNDIRNRILFSQFKRPNTKFMKH